MTYQEQLADPRWKAVSERIKRAANYRCEDCSLPSREGCALDVHHCCYLTGFMAWDYPDSLLICVCHRCHEARQKLEQAAMMQFAKAMRQMSQTELEGAVWRFLASEYIQLFSECNPKPNLCHSDF